MIIRKSKAELDVMHRAGQLLATLHEELRDIVAPGVTLNQLDAYAHDYMRKHGAEPSFLGYGGGGGRRPFPKVICASVNDEIVHGVPSDRPLEHGDLIKLDEGLILDGYHADSAVTWIVGGDDAVSQEVRDLVRTTREGLWNGILQARDGHRMGDVGAAIEATAEPRGYGVVKEYVGHGIGRSLHEDPQVPNVGRAGRGVKLRSGLVIAIEPQFNLGTSETAALDDDWTVVTADGELSAHWEHTVAITPDGPWVLTARSDETEWPLAQPDRIPVAVRV